MVEAVADPMGGRYFWDHVTARSRGARSGRSARSALGATQKNERSRSGVSESLGGRGTSWWVQWTGLERPLEMSMEPDVPGPRR